LFGTKFDAFEKAIEVAHQDMVRVPTEVQKQVGSLKELHDEKFKGIATRFDERDARTKEVAELNQKAIDAALQAAKEAVAKSEAATTKQIDSLGTLIATTAKTSDDKIAAVKENVTIIESRANGGNAVWGWVFGAIGMVAGIVAVLVSVLK
jgi:hypothetical protein